jgi:DNA-binding response OmpR family regulator
MTVRSASAILFYLALVHIARIRRNIDDPWPVKLLHTVRGVGFVLRMEGTKT